ncbi:MAG: cytochrome B [Omnitrophica bacterium GWA2_52_8]|nr:MAG: cytochrome B [Omnitrophica bacterium GWA2_52_8]
MFKPLRKVYDWSLNQARSPHAQSALFLIAFAESSFFPVPPDVLLIAMVLAHREKWLRYFWICLTGSVLGGIAGYGIGLGVWEIVHPWFYGHVFSEQTFDKVRQLYAQHDFWIVFIAAFTPIPYKVFTITAGVTQINFLSFVMASVIGRGGRFILVAGLLYFFGEKVHGFIDKYFNILTVVFTLLLIGGFVLIKVLH